MKATLIVGAAFLLTGCMVTQVALLPDQFVAADHAQGVRLQTEVRIHASSAAEQVLRAGTVWTLTGSVPQGDVFHTRDQILIVNSFSVFEADIVVKDEKVVGYYNPVARSFTAATPVGISFLKEDQK